MNSSEALFELSLINAEESNTNFDDFFIWGLEKGIPPEILTRLKKVWDFTKVAIEESISIGKIIVNTIWKFMKAHPQLSVGLALGAAVGLLVAAIPFLNFISSIKILSSYLCFVYVIYFIISTLFLFKIHSKNENI